MIESRLYLICRRTFKMPRTSSLFIISMYNLIVIMVAQRKGKKSLDFVLILRSLWDWKAFQSCSLLLGVVHKLCWEDCTFFDHLSPWVDIYLHFLWYKPRTTDTQWRHKSNISERFGIGIEFWIFWASVVCGSKHWIS